MRRPIGGLSWRERRAITSQLFLRRVRWRAQLIQYATLLTLSVLIATAGLLADSTAVVIAAMLVAPLMTPILGVAASITMALPWRQLQQVALVVASVALVVALGSAVPWLFNVPRDVVLPNEVLARTRPGLGDLVIAASAGFAGAFILIWRNAASALPGVAIAVSLVPPLCACGILLRFGEPALAGQAFLLFFTNFALIILTACSVFLAAGFRARVRTIGKRLRIAIGVTLAAALVLGAAIPLIGHTIEGFRATRERLAAVEIVEDWAGATRIEIEELLIDRRRVELVFILDVPFADALKAEGLGSMVPQGMTARSLEEALSQRLERDIVLTLRMLLRFEAQVDKAA